MIAPIEKERDGMSQSEADRKETQRVRNTYPSSGMYLNDDSTQPLWTVDWHSVQVFVSSDGEHVIRMGGYQTEFSGEALTFFKRNEILGSYKIGDLIDFRPIPVTPGSIDWEESLSLDDANQTFSVFTPNKERYVFSFTNGEMLSSIRPVRIIGAILLLSLSFAVLIFIRNRRNKMLKEKL